MFTKDIRRINQAIADLEDDIKNKIIILCNTTRVKFTAGMGSTWLKTDLDLINDVELSDFTKETQERLKVNLYQKEEDIKFELKEGTISDTVFFEEQDRIHDDVRYVNHIFYHWFPLLEEIRKVQDQLNLGYDILNSIKLK